MHALELAIVIRSGGRGYVDEIVHGRSGAHQTWRYSAGRERGRQGKVLDVSAPLSFAAAQAFCTPVFAVEGRGRDLFSAVERLDLEGIVAKRKADPYAPGTVWYKVKNRAYTQMDGRWELFERRR